MKHFTHVSFPFPILLLLMLTLLVTGCGTPRAFPAPSGEAVGISVPDPSFEDWMESNPCGVLRVRKPLFNITGRLTAEARENASLFLFVAPNATAGAANYVMKHCRPITGTNLLNESRFVLDSLPFGTYVVALPSRAFIRPRGVPLVDETNGSNKVIEIGATGGNRHYQFATFTLQSLP